MEGNSATITLGSSIDNVHCIHNYIFISLIREFWIYVMDNQILKHLKIRVIKHKTYLTTNKG